MFTYICDVIKFTLNKGTAMKKYNQQKVAAIIEQLQEQLDAAAQDENWDAWDSIKDAIYNLQCYKTTDAQKFEAASHDDYLQSQY